MQQFEIAFSGQIAPAAQLNQVKAALGRLFKADEAVIERLFSGQRIVIKQSVNAEEANKYQVAFERIGAVIEIRERVTAPNLDEAVPDVPASEASAETESGSAAAGTATAMLNVTPRDEYMAAFRDVQAPDFGIAPLGEDLQPAKAATPALELDLSALSIAPAGSDLGQLPSLDKVTVPDVSHIKLLGE